jgi:hypothetical protein
MADLTDADLDAIEARLNAAGLNPSADTTIGLIAAIDDPDGGKSLLNLTGFADDAVHELWAHAPTDLRALLAAVRRGRDVIDKLYDDLVRAALAEEPDDG